MISSDVAAAEETLHVAVIEHVGDAMQGWDSATRGDSWTPPAADEIRRDLPPLRLKEPGAPKAS